MNKVVNIHLNGNAFQVEERGYEVLQSYLEQARSQLANNPDRDEVMQDLEQAVADKCRRFLRADKNVVLDHEVEQIIEEMGPVHDSESVDDAADNDGVNGEAEQTNYYDGQSSPPRKLYRLRNDRMIEGICSGIGAYLGVDATIIRVIAVILLLMTSGVAAIVYLIMIMVVPVAKTPEEHAAAHGAPFDAREVMERAKANMRGLRDSHEKHKKRRNPDYWRRHGNGSKSGLGRTLTVIAIVFGVLLILNWMRFPSFNNGFMGTGFMHYNWYMPFQPWSSLIVTFLVILGLSSVVKSLSRDEDGSGNLLISILKICLFIFIVMFVIQLIPFIFHLAGRLLHGVGGVF